MVILCIEENTFDAFSDLKDVPPELKEFVVRKRLGSKRGGEKNDRD
jgi:hypothetical protein